MARLEMESGIFHLDLTPPPLPPRETVDFGTDFSVNLFFWEEFRNERSDKFWWKSVLVDLCWAPGEAVHKTPHVFVISLCVRL